MKIEYRPFQKNDEKEIYQVAFESWSYFYQDIFEPEFISNFIGKYYSPEMLLAFLPFVKKKEMFFHVAYNNENGKIVGFCNIGDRGQGLELFRIYLLPPYTGKGIGKNLLKLGEKFIESKGIFKYFCYVHKKNTVGINFYLKNGFERNPEKDKKKDDEWYMEKKFYP